MTSKTTAFERLALAAFRALYPEGLAKETFYAPHGSGAYARGVEPDFVLPDGRWIDFKLGVSYRESHDVAWRPSALYSSLRKYIDHPANRHGTLNIVYCHLYGTLRDVRFPISRGRKALVRDAAEFRRRVILVPIEKLFARIQVSSARWVVDEIKRL